MVTELINVFPLSSILMKIYSAYKWGRLTTGAYDELVRHSITNYNLYLNTEKNDYLDAMGKRKIFSM